MQRDLRQVGRYGTTQLILIFHQEEFAVCRIILVGRNYLLDLDLPPLAVCSCSGKNGFCSVAFPRPVAGGSLL